MKTGTKTYFLSAIFVYLYKLRNCGNESLREKSGFVNNRLRVKYVTNKRNLLHV